MPRKARKPAINYKKTGRRRNSAPNVYIPSKEEQATEPKRADGASTVSESNATTQTSAVAIAEERRLRRRQARAGRRGRPVSAANRTSVYTRDLPSELRKIGRWIPSWIMRC